MSRIQVRRGTSTQWTTSNPVLAQGEPGYETNTGKFKIGNGSTAWNSLAYTGTVTSVAGRLGDVTLTKSDVGLNNVDNTADIDKQVLSAVTANSAAIADAAVKLQNIRTINGINFDGTANITVPALARSVQTITSATTLGSSVNTDYVALLTTGDVTLPSAVSNQNTYTIINTGTAQRLINTTSSQTIDGKTAPLTITPGTEFYYLKRNLNAAQRAWETVPVIGTGDFTFESYSTIIDTNLYAYSDYLWQGTNLSVLSTRTGAGGGYPTLTFGLGAIYPGSVNGSYSLNSGFGKAHFALVRQGTTVRYFVNGTLYTAETWPANTTNITESRARIGTPNLNLEELVVYKGWAKYSASFTPPTTIPEPFNKITLISNGSNWISV